ncbi:MAG: metal ABC transporter substrate-binding protein [Rhizobiales bacterium]|nr:metal ABC transporter substrate-binding protein [Hyphomicrobiales bacterium]
MSILRTAVIGLFAAMMLTSSPGIAQERIKVIATFSILADLVKNVGGDRVDVAPIVAAGSDAHVYAPTPADARKVAEARLVFINGLGFEGWLDRLVKASGSKAAVVLATKGIKVRKTGGGHDHGHKNDHGHNVDPHAWQSVGNVKVYVANIRDALAAADPAGAASYQADAAAYQAKLDALEAEVRGAVAKIPAARRKIITNHDAFGYFEAAYGVKFIAPQGVATDAEPSAREVARIITQIKRQKIPAVFLENVSDPRLMQRIAKETGAKIGGTLYSDALTETNGPVPTYIDLIRHNLTTLVGALTS